MTPTPFLEESYLTTELRQLFREVTTMRDETRSYTCRCSDPDCPFAAEAGLELEREIDSYDEEAEKESPDLGFGGSMEMILSQKHSSLPYPLALVPAPPTSTHKQRQLTQSTCNINTCSATRAQKRADGTILEYDYPGMERRKIRSGLSLNYLNRPDVFLNEEADCQVDQDGLTNDREEYSFSRQAPGRSRVVKVSKKVGQTNSMSSSACYTC